MIPRGRKQAGHNLWGTRFQSRVRHLELLTYQRALGLKVSTNVEL
jgi:hypothetical protein